MSDHATARGGPPEENGMVAMRLYRLGVDEHEGETGRLVGAIAPGMVGAALDQDVPRSEQHLALVHQRVDFAGEHDGVIHRTGLVKAGMARRSAVKGVAMTGAVVAARTLALERGQALHVGRILDDAEDRAVPGRRQPKR